MSKILSKIGKKKRITGKKKRWEKSKIGSAPVLLLALHLPKFCTGATTCALLIIT